MANRRGEELTDEQWEGIEPLIPSTTPRRRPGQAVERDTEVLNGMLWVQRSGEKWQ